MSAWQAQMLSKRVMAEYNGKKISWKLEDVRRRAFPPIAGEGGYHDMFGKNQAVPSKASNVQALGTSIPTLGNRAFRNESTWDSNSMYKVTERLLCAQPTN